MNSGSYVRLKTSLPSVLSFIAPHSPFFSVFDSTQSGTKSLSESVQERVVLMVVRMIGFRSRSVLVAEKASMYFPMLNLNAVFPLPNTSYATPTRGVTSSHFTLCVDPFG